VDTVAPTTFISGEAGNFTLSASEAVTGFQCSLDGGGWQWCVGSEYASMPPGSYSLRARSIDAAQNLGEPSSPKAWTVAAPPSQPTPPTTPPTTPGDPKPPVAVAARLSFASGTLKIPSTGRVVVATVTCGTAPCTISTASKVKVKVGRTTYTLTALAPRSVKTRRTAKITFSVPSSVRKALRRKTVSVPLKVTVGQAGGKRVARSGKVKLRG
jgi:hypothetical protein